MGANNDPDLDAPITLCAVLNGLRHQRVKSLTLNYESHLGEVVEIAVKRSKGAGIHGAIAEAFGDAEPHEAEMGSCGGGCEPHHNS